MIPTGLRYFYYDKILKLCLDWILKLYLGYIRKRSHGFLLQENRIGKASF